MKSGGGSHLRAEHNGDPLDTRRDFREKLQPLARQRSLEIAEPGNVPAGSAEARDETGPDWIRDARKYDRDCARHLLERSGCRRRVRKQNIRSKFDQFFRTVPHAVDVASTPSNVYSNILAVDPPMVGKSASEPRKQGSRLRIVFLPTYQHANPPQLLALLRAGH